MRKEDGKCFRIVLVAFIGVSLGFWIGQCNREVVETVRIVEVPVITKVVRVDEGFVYSERVHVVNGFYKGYSGKITSNGQMYSNAFNGEQKIWVDVARCWEEGRESVCREVLTSIRVEFLTRAQ